MNATLIDSVRGAGGGGLSFTIGLILLAGLAVWLLLEIFRSLLRAAADSRYQRVALEKLRWQVEKAKEDRKKAIQAETGWNGIRRFVVAKKEKQCDDVHSFYLKPHDGCAIPAFKPGQYLTFSLNIPGRDKPLVRCYSLSDIARATAGAKFLDCYRVTIKKEKAPPKNPEYPPGAGSTFFNEVIKEGDILNVKSPSGHFFLDMEKSCPIVLLAGGVGITPMLCMANAIAASGKKREAYFFFGAKNQKEHIHKNEMEKLAAQHENIHVHVCYSSPDPGDVKGQGYHEGRVSIGLLKEVLPSNNFEYYLCGAGAFMKSLTDGLSEWGVPDKDVYFEAFGPATIVRKSPPPTAAETTHLQKLNVTFKKSGKTLQWDPTSESLWKFAAANGVRIESGCLAGSCGACETAKLNGDVNYAKKPDYHYAAGTCLPCVCRPQNNLELDA